MYVRRTALVLLTLLICSTVRAQNPNEARNEEFFAAAKKGDVAAVKALLDKGVDVNARTRYGATAISYAADKGNLEVIRVLIEAGADVNVKDTFYGEVPLGWALMRSHADIVGLLLQKGAAGKERALMHGAQNGDANMVKAVLAVGGLQKDTLNSALGAATRGNKTEVIDLLKKAGAVLVEKPEFKVDEATLKSYTGSFKNDQVGEIIFTLTEGRLGGRVVGQGPFTMAATDKTSFTVREVDGIQINFKVEGDKVTGMTLKQAGMTFEFKKAEQK
jgi:hypothetical protein